MRLDPTYEKLTHARMRVLALVAEDKTIQEIADELSISYEGARSQVRDLRGILGCATKGEVGVWWRDHSDAYFGYVATCARLAPPS